MEYSSPKGWHFGKLYELLRPVKATVKKYSGAKKYYSTGSISNKIVEEGNYYFDTKPSRANREVIEDDILQARMKNTNKALLVSEELKNSLFSTGFIQIRPYGQTIVSKYVFYFLNSEFFLDQKDRLCTGATQQSINDENAKLIDFLLPPLAEQKRIVEKLDKTFEQIDLIDIALKRIPEIIQNFKAEVLAMAVSGKLTETWRKGNTFSGKDLLQQVLTDKRQIGSKIKSGALDDRQLFDAEFPSSWAIGFPGEIASIDRYSLAIGPFGSNLKVDDYRTSGTPLIFVRHIKANNFEELSPKFVSQEKAIELEAHSVQGLDLLVTKMGDPPGDCEIYPKHLPKAIITSDCLKFRVWDKYFNHYFYKHVINSSFVKNQLGLITFGVAQQKISLERFRTILLPIPPTEEQNEIVARVESLFAKADLIEEKYKTLKSKIDSLPQAILHKAFKGELVQQLATDGDAKDLLKEIQKLKIK